MFLGTWHSSSALSALSLTAHVLVTLASSSYPTQQLAGKKCGKMNAIANGVDGDLFTYVYTLLVHTNHFFTTFISLIIYLQYSQLLYALFMVTNSGPPIPSGTTL